MPRSSQPKPFTFVAFPKFICAWPLILAHFLLPILQKASGGFFTEQLMTEIWGVILIFVLMTLGFDFSGLWSTIIMLVTTLLIVVAMFITAKYEIPVLETLQRIVQAMQFSISGDTLWLLGFFLSLVYLGMMIVCYLNHRWIVSNGKIERTKFLLRSQHELPINPSRPVNYHILDVMEYILTFGGGHLRVKTAEHGHEYIGLVLFVKSVDERIDFFEKMPVTKR